MDHLSICSNNQHERDPLDNFCITCHIEILNISQSNVEDYINQCEQLDQLGIIDEALNCLEMGIQINLSIEDTYNKIGDALRRLNDETEAYFYFKQGFNIKKKNIQLLRAKSHILQKQQRYEEAIICQNQIEDINKNEQKGQKGILFQLLKKDEQAKEEYDQCLKLDQEGQDVILMNKGKLLQDQMKYEEALECYDAALKINPKYAETMNNKGITLHKLKKYDEALKCYDAALKINPKDAETMNNKGITLDEQQKYEKALKCYDAALKINPKYAETMNNKGITLLKQEKQEEALKYYDAALKINPKFAKAMNNKGNNCELILKESPQTNNRNMKKLKNAMMLHQRLILNMQKL